MAMLLGSYAIVTKASNAHSMLTRFDETMKQSSRIQIFSRAK